MPAVLQTRQARAEQQDMGREFYELRAGRAVVYVDLLSRAEYAALELTLPGWDGPSPAVAYEQARGVGYHYTAGQPHRLDVLPADAPARPITAGEFHDAWRRGFRTADRDLLAG